MNQSINQMGQSTNQMNQSAEFKIPGSITKEELTTKLKTEAPYFSDKQINEIATEVMYKIQNMSELSKVEQDIETQQTKHNLKNLSQSVVNNPNQDYKLEISGDNNGTINLKVQNTIKNTNNINNINITINTPKPETPTITPKPEAPTITPKIVTPTITPKPETPTISPKIVTPTITPKPEAPTITPKIVTPTITPTSEQFLNNTTIDRIPDTMTPVGFLTMIDNLLQEIKEIKNGIDDISKKKLTDAGKKTMELAKGNLKQYEKLLNGAKETFKKQNRAEVRNDDITFIKKLRESVDLVKEDIAAGGRGELSKKAPSIYTSRELGKESNKSVGNYLKSEQKILEQAKKGAILNIFGGNIQKATDFLIRMAQGEYTQADYQLFTTNAAVLIPCFENCGIDIPAGPQRFIQTNGGGTELSGTPRGSIDYSNMDFGEAFQKGGVAGVVDKALSSCKNMTPGQRNTWKSLAVLGGFAAGIFGLYKFVTSKRKRGEKAVIAGATILGTEILTGEGPISLFNKLMTGGFTKEWRESKFGSGVFSSFGDAVDGIGNSGIEESQTIVPSAYSMMIFNPTTTVGDIRNLTSTFKNDGNAWINFRQQAIDKLKSGNYGNACIERFSATFSNNFDEQKRNEWLASMGITDSTNDKKTIYELAGNSTSNEIVLNKFKSDNGLKETDIPNKKQELHDYINGLKQRNQAIDTTVLESHKNDWFKSDDKLSYTERDEDKQNKEKLVNQLESQPIDPQKKEQLKQAIQTFYDERTINSKPNLNDFLLRMENDFLVVKSHNGQETKINIKNNSIQGFGSKNGNNYEISFSNLPDLFNVADLTNDILSQQKGQKISNFPPFQYKKSRKGICFNNADMLSFNMDTRVLSTGRRGATSKIDTLYEHPEEYAQYLSNRRIENNKVNIDSTSYPLVKMLSNSGIQFFNEQEVKELETWLKGVKEKLKVFKCHPDGNPFSITIMLFGNKLRFKTINGDIEEFPENVLKKFPTLTHTGNEEKFLNALNNSSNKMRGSAL